MKTVGGMTMAVPKGLGSSAVDSNRFYSMLLDARNAVSVTENMHDVSEKLLKGEKDNAKLALDQLWALKKTLSGDQSDETIDRMIAYYQEKINALREKEESIKKVSKETRSLIEDKKRYDTELASIKTQVGEYTREMRELKLKIETLGKREQELRVNERKLRKEIGANEALIVNGLYDIILRRPDTAVKDVDEDGEELVARELAKYGIDTSVIGKKAQRSDAERDEDEDAIATRRFLRETAEDYGDDVLNKEDAPRDARHPAAAPAPINRPEPVPEPVVYPKSVVRMGGKVIGEYYHDGNAVSKDKRHYIYNSRFMAEHLSAAMKSIKSRYSQNMHAETGKLIEDAMTRVRGNTRFHFEVATNEILNDKNLKQAAADLRRRAWDDVERFAARLSAKIDALGSNYGAMLQEQMERCSEKR